MVEMHRFETVKKVSVTLPDGTKLNFSDLPEKNTKRWVARHKRNVANAVLYKLITFEEACARYELSEEELLCWLKSMKFHGTDALKSTRLMEYRQPKVASVEK